jgi:hypothetical protein
MPKYVCHCPKVSRDNLCFRKIGFLACDILIIASLLEPPLKRLNRAFKPKLGTKDVVLNNSILPRFRDVINNLVDLCVREKEGRARSFWAFALRVVIGQNMTN